MSVSLDTRITDAYAAGFRGSALVTIVSISLCECGIGSASGCETGCNPDAGASSCGVLQIYQPAHPGTAACASTPACCFTLGWQISSRGTNFHPWTTFQNGCWRTHIAAVTAAINAMPPPIGPGSTPAPSPAPGPVPVQTPPAGGSTLLPVLLLGAGAAIIGAAVVRRDPGLRARARALEERVGLQLRGLDRGIGFGAR